MFKYFFFFMLVGYLEEIYYIFFVGDSMLFVNGDEKVDGEMFSIFDNDFDIFGKNCVV